MKAVILAGGHGTRLSEETSLKPKPMVEIGNMPIIWHIMKIYSFYDIKDFIICCGYKGEVIREFFLSLFKKYSDVTINTSNNEIEIHNNLSESWNVTMLDTGIDTMTGGRLKRVKDYLNKDEDFCFTYGDGLANVNIRDLIDYHKSKKVLATLTAVFPPARFGALKIKDGMVKNFDEKPKGDNKRINGGFFILSPKVIDYIKGDKTIWEKEPMSYLAENDSLAAYNHDGFWQPMDTLNDKKILNEIWEANEAPWKIWK
jgi:glucose-1-phosphate cytidylyltransferase